MITVEVKNVDLVVELINGIDKELSNPTGLNEYLAPKILEVINEESKSKLSTSDNYVAHNKYKFVDNGILFYNDVQSSDGTYYSLIVEYGSGTHAEGEPFHHTKTYDLTSGLYWLVPVDEGSDLFKTNYPIVTIEPYGDFFMVFGQEPKHIYTDAAKTISRKSKQWIGEYLQMLLNKLK